MSSVANGQLVSYRHCILETGPESHERIGAVCTVPCKDPQTESRHWQIVVTIHFQGCGHHFDGAMTTAKQ
jgi:hypothetical protein